MLKELKVCDFALIQDIQLTFGAHLNVLTGETGAGKSIIVDAMKLLLGERANVRDIRHGQQQAIVEGVFDVSTNNGVLKKINELGLSGEPLILSREINSNGKNTCRINRRVVTLAQFRDVALDLVSIYGQHDYQALAQQEKQLSLLDSLGDERHRDLRTQTYENYREAQRSGRELKLFVKSQKEQAAKMHAAKSALEELLPLKLVRGEEKEIGQAYKRAANRQVLIEQTRHAYALLYDDEDSCYMRLGLALDAIKDAANVDQSLSSFLPDLEQALISVGEISRDLSSYEAEENAHDMERLSARLNLQEELKRRYRCSIDELIDKIAVWQKMLNDDATSMDRLNELQKSYQNAKRNYAKAADRLHESRKKIAEYFSKRLLKELSDLSMPHARFSVRFDQNNGTIDGYDEICFELSANPGVPLAPLHDIASGGEMSRIMLAFKNILSDRSGTDTLIFDEIDTGIGGITLNQVAEKLSSVARHEQVICVTHAAPIAARADHHFYIEKRTDGAKTDVHVVALDEEEIIYELARMLGGQDLWHLDYARQLREKQTNINVP